MNCESLSIVTDCVGTIKEAVETANDVAVAVTGLKPGVNEKKWRPLMSVMCHLINTGFQAGV